MKISNNKILITGGASGIGLGLTERFIKENNTVIICETSSRHWSTGSHQVSVIAERAPRTSQGWFFGFHDDIWQAYALAVFTADTTNTATECKFSVDVPGGVHVREVGATDAPRRVLWSGAILWRASTAWAASVRRGRTGVIRCRTTGRPSGRSRSASTRVHVRRHVNTPSQEGRLSGDPLPALWRRPPVRARRRLPGRLQPRLDLSREDRLG